jgi:hypothetical protein
MFSRRTTGYLRCKFSLNEKFPDLKSLMEELFLIETRPAWKRWINDQLGLKKLPDTREYVDTEPPADADELGGEASEEEPESIPAPLPRLLPPDNSPLAGNPFQDDPPPESGA